MEKIKETGAGNTPKFRLGGLYVKDISFENPLTPGIFLQQVQKPEINVSVDVGLATLKENTYEVGLKIIVTAGPASGKPVFLVELNYAGLFSINPELPATDHEKVLLVDCAATIFPFARRLVADLVQEGGFPQLLLEPINFEAIYAAKRLQGA